MGRILYTVDGWLSLARNEKGCPYVKCHDGAVAVPLMPNQDILMVEEESPLPGTKRILNFPGGAVESGENPAVAINRELQEEIGFQAAHIELLGVLQAWKYLAARQFVYLAQELTSNPLDGDEDYEMRLVSVPLSNVGHWVTSGKIVDVTSIAALYMVQAFLNTES